MKESTIVNLQRAAVFVLVKNKHFIRRERVIRDTNNPIHIDMEDIDTIDKFSFTAM